jgi:hypothetical protein
MGAGRAADGAGDGAGGGAQTGTDDGDTKDVGGVGEAGLLRRVVDAMPSAVFVMDELGTVTLASARAAALVHRTMDDVVGSSVLEFVDPDAAWAYASAMDIALSDHYRHTFAGPVRISVLTASGATVGADLWTANCLDDPQVRGLVCELTPQTASLGIAEAVALAATGLPIEQVAATAAEAMAGYPVSAHAAVLLADGDVLRAAATSGLPAALVDTVATSQPWAAMQQVQDRVLYGSVDDLPSPLRELTEAAGYGALWFEPIRVGDAAPAGALVIGRHEVGEPTPNELAHVHQAAGVLALALLRSA